MCVSGSRHSVQPVKGAWVSHGLGHALRLRWQWRGESIYTRVAKAVLPLPLGPTSRKVGSWAAAAAFL